MVPQGTLWYLMVPYGTLWYHMLPYGTLCRPFRLLRLEIFFSVLVYPFPACHQNETKKSVLVSFSEHFRSGSVLVSTFFFWFLLWFPSGILYSKTKRLMTTSNKTDFSFFFCCSWFPFWFRPAPGLGFHSGSSLNEIFRSGSGLLWTQFFFCFVLRFRSGVPFW